MQRKNTRLIGLLVFGYASTSLANIEIEDQLKDDLIREEIIVTANRSESKVKETGSSVSVVTLNDITNTNAIFANDLLRQIPGLSVNQSGPIGSATQIRIRGGEGNHTLVLVDGINVNDPAIGSEFNFADLFLNDATQIEIVRGSQTALYGSDTIGGVINIRTVNPKKSGVHGHISFEAGNKDTNLQVLGLTAKGENSYGTANLSKYSTDGSNASLMGSEKDGYSNQSMLFKYRADLLPTLNTSLFFRRADNHSQTDPQDFSYPSTPSQGLVIDGDENSDTMQEHRGFSLNYQSANKPISSSLRMQSSRTESRFFQEGKHLLGSHGARDKLDWHSTVEFNQKNNKHRLGLLLGYEKLKFMNFSQDYLAANYEENLSQSNIAGQYHISLSKASHINFSARGDYNTRFNNAHSFRFSLSHIFMNSKTRLHASASTGSTNPSFIEIFGYAPSNFEGNPDLAPEKSVNLDLGLEHTLFKNNLIDLTIFSAKLKDEIITVFDPLSFKSNSINDDQQSDRIGLELSAMGYLRENWSAKASYTHLKAEDGNNLEEIRRPKHNGSLNLNYRSNNQKTNINVAAIFNGEQSDLEFVASTPATTIRLPAYRLFNLSISYAFSSKLTTRLRIRNLMDSEYSEIFSYRGPGRSIVAGLEYTF